MEFERRNSLGWLVAALSNNMARSLADALKRHDLPLQVWPPLMCLWEREGIAQTELADMAKVPVYTTTRVLDRLEEMGLVVRRPDPHSRRAHRIYLTEAGRALRPALTALAQEVNEAYLAPLSPEEQAILLGLLRRVIEKVPANLADDGPD